MIVLIIMIGWWSSPSWLRLMLESPGVGPNPEVVLFTKNEAIERYSGLSRIQFLYYLSFAERSLPYMYIPIQASNEPRKTSNEPSYARGE